MQGGAVPVTVRVSNGGGNPEVPDYAPDVRGLAVKMYLPDGSRTDIVAQSAPRFPFHRPEPFIELLRVQRPGVRSALKMPAVPRAPPGGAAHAARERPGASPARELRDDPLLRRPRVPVRRRRGRVALRPLHAAPAAAANRDLTPWAAKTARPRLPPGGDPPAGRAMGRCASRSSCRSRCRATTSTTRTCSGRRTASAWPSGTLELTDLETRARDRWRHPRVRPDVASSTGSSSRTTRCCGSVRRRTPSRWRTGPAADDVEVDSGRHARPERPPGRRHRRQQRPRARPPRVSWRAPARASSIACRNVAKGEEVASEMPGRRGGPRARPRRPELGPRVR